jgi:hypothetical protein
MLIKNSGPDEVRVEMRSRVLRLGAGEERVVAPNEVRDPRLRRALQERSISIVRPATEAEEEALRKRLEEDDPPA